MEKYPTVDDAIEGFKRIDAMWAANPPKNFTPESNDEVIAQVRAERRAYIEQIGLDAWAKELAELMESDDEVEDISESEVDFDEYDEVAKEFPDTGDNIPASLTSAEADLLIRKAIEATN